MNAARARYFALNRLAANKKCEGFSIAQPENALKESLRVLSSLYEEGVISKEEYLQKREQVISEFSLWVSTFSPSMPLVNDVDLQ